MFFYPTVKVKSVFTFDW